MFLVLSYVFIGTCFEIILNNFSDSTCFKCKCEKKNPIYFREALQEDAEGSLQPSIDDMLHKAKRRKLLEKISNVRLGMVIIICCYQEILIV